MIGSSEYSSTREPARIAGVRLRTKHVSTSHWHQPPSPNQPHLREFIISLHPVLTRLPNLLQRLRPFYPTCIPLFHICPPLSSLYINPTTPLRFSSHSLLLKFLFITPKFPQMEVPVLSRISDFEAELALLQNSSLNLRFLNLSPITVQGFWTWGALILALLAYFSSFATRVKYVILRLRKGTSVISQPILQQLYFDDSEDETCSSSYSSEDESSDEEQEEDEEDYEYEDQRLVSDDFRVAGSGNYEETLGQRRSFSWSDFMNGKSVVKSWDDISMPSPAVLVSAGLETSRNVALRVFDTRVGRQIPQMFAEWQPAYRLHKFHGILNSSEDDISGDEDVKVRSVVVRDLRKIKSPLENLTEFDFKTWLDSDAVIINGEGGLGNGCGSVVSRCRDAVFSYLF